MDKTNNLVSNALVVAPSQEEIIKKVYALYGPKGTLSEARLLLEIHFITNAEDHLPEIA